MHHGLGGGDKLMFALGRLVFAAGLFAAPPALAAAAIAANLEASSLVRLFAFAGLVLPAGFLLAWLFRRFGRFVQGAGGGLGFDGFSRVNAGSFRCLARHFPILFEANVFCLPVLQSLMSLGF